MYKGIVFNVISSLLFVGSSYLMHFVLGYRMSPEQYGIMGSIITILDFEYLFLNNGVRQSISKEISKNKYVLHDLIAKCLLFQLLLIGILFSINFFGTEFFCQILGDRAFDKYIKIAAFIIPFNGLYVITLGVNEGFQKFTSSALVGIVYAAGKLCVIPFVLFMFADPIMGTEMGLMTAIALALLTGIVTLIYNRKSFKSTGTEKIGIKYYAKNTLNFSLFFIIVSVVLSVDTLIVKAVSSDDDMAGFYTGAVNFAKVSYFILSAFFTIILPIITYYYEKKEYDRVGNTIKNFNTIIIALVVPITVIISATSRELLTTFYNSGYIAAGPALTLLSWSHLFMGVTVLYNMIIVAVGKKKFSSVLAVCILAVDIPLTIIMTEHFGITGTAFASIACTFIAVIVSIAYAKRSLKAIFEKNHLKIMSMNILLWGILELIGRSINFRNIILLCVFYVVVYALYVFILHIIHFIDFRQIIRLFSTKH